jgi:citrate:succinate antiporter
MAVGRAVHPGFARPPAAAATPRHLRFNWRVVAPIAVWLVIMLLPAPRGLNTTQWHYFAVFLGAITGVVVESLSPGAVGIIAVTFAAVMRYVDADPTKSITWALSGFSDTTVWLIVGAFVFAIGYRESGLGRRIALALVRRLGGRTLGLGYAVAFADLVLAPGTPSNTARSGGTIFPIISNIPRLYGSEPGSTARKIGGYLMWTAFAATAVTSSMFATSLAPNVAAIGIISHIAHINVTWPQWFLGFLPVGVVLLLLVPALTYVLYPPEIKSSPEIPAWAGEELAKMGRFSRKEWTMTGLILAAMFFWITGATPGISLPFLGSNFVNATTVVLAVIAAMLLTGVIDYRAIVAEAAAWEVFLYFTTLLVLADGLNRLGIIKWFAGVASEPLAGLAPVTAMILLVALFFWIHYFFSSLTAHTAAVLPIVLGVGLAMRGVPLVPFVLLCVYSLGLMGVISPYATGPAPIYFTSGYIARGQFWKLGLIFGALFFVALIAIGTPWLFFLRH